MAVGPSPGSATPGDVVVIGLVPSPKSQTNDVGRASTSIVDPSAVVDDVKAPPGGMPATQNHPSRPVRPAFFGETPIDTPGSGIVPATCCTIGTTGGATGAAGRGMYHPKPVIVPLHTTM